MKGFKSYSGHRVGASHIAKNMKCEDYASTYDDELVSIAVISDGHGDARSFRSAKGAQIACDVSIDCVKKLIYSSPVACDVLRHSPERVITELERAITREWNDAVSDDLSNNKIKDDELEGLPEDVIDTIKAGRSLNKIYGCTLIMCVLIEGFWFGIHIGDGKCVIAKSNGVYTQPIPWDENGCVGNRSTSICNSNAFAGFRYAYSTDIPTGLFVASDGIDESFDESGLYRCYYTLGYWVQTMQSTELDSKMDELLSQITNNGSGDDVSISCILSDANDIKKPYASSEQVADKLKELINNIKESEEQFDELKESKKEATECIDSLKSEVEELKKKLSVQEERIKDKEQELSNIDINIQQVIVQLQQSLTQLPKAKETKERIDQYWKGNGVEIVEDTELDYTPKYSNEYLKETLAVIEETNKVVQPEDETESEHGHDNIESHDSESKDTYDEIIQIDEKNEEEKDDEDIKNQKDGFFRGFLGRKK